MEQKKLLILSLFPLTNADFGGQLRLVNFCKAYQNEGFAVEVAGVLGSPSYQNEQGYLPYPMKDIESAIERSFCLEDLAIGELFVNSIEHFKKLSNNIRTEPDLIHIESPWLFKFAEKYAQHCQKRPKLVYSSQNIEAPLRRTILKRYYDDEYTEKMIGVIDEVERYAAQHADLIFAVTERDKTQIEEWTRTKVIVAPNGVQSYDDLEIDWSEFKSLNLPSKYALYCASGYDPNYFGFLEVFKQGFGALNPDEKLVITGSICKRFETQVDFSEIIHMKASSMLLGTVSQNLLAAILRNAHCIILPILEGGGSNLKTAEAIVQGCYVLGTNFAFRGYEDYLSSTGVYIGENSTDFLKKLREIMAMPSLRLSCSENLVRKTLLWDNCLRPAINELKRL